MKPSMLTKIIAIVLMSSLVLGTVGCGTEWESLALDILEEADHKSVNAHLIRLIDHPEDLGCLDLADSVPPTEIKVDDDTHVSQPS